MTKYWSKFPRQSFETAAPRRGFSRTVEAAMGRIEKTYRAGYTQEPYVQLVEETDTHYRVVAEWMPGAWCWVSEYEAAGLVAHPVR
jgi:hypothetical protein